MMDAKIAEQMKEILLQIASERGTIVHKMAVDEGHAHMLVSMRLWMSVSQALQYLNVTAETVGHYIDSTNIKNTFQEQAAVNSRSLIRSFGIRPEEVHCGEEYARLSDICCR